MRRSLPSRLFTFASLALVVIACKKTQSAEPVLTKCASDADCVYTTENRGGCCVNPCGNPAKAVHHDEATAITQYNADYCTPARRKECPQAGACMERTPPPANPPKCNAGACTNG